MCTFWWQSWAISQTSRRRVRWPRNWRGRACSHRLPGPGRARPSSSSGAVALENKNPLAQLDVKRLPPEDQRAIALALEPDKKLCSKCSNQAKTSMEFTLSWFNDVPEPDAGATWAWSSCAFVRAAVCLSCGKPGALAQEGEHLRSSNPLVLGHHRFSNLRCTDCKRAAIAPFTAADKRKYSEVLGAEMRSKRLRM